MIEKMKTSRIIGMFMALSVAAMFFTSSISVLAQDSADTEPNDYLWDAVNCYDGDFISGSLDETSDYSDYYQIWLNSGDYLSVVMTGTGDDFDLDLYDTDEWEVDSSWNFGSTESVSHTATRGGDHYICAYASSGTGSYSLSITVIEGAGGSPGNLYVGGIPYVPGDPQATLPTMTVGDGVYWGGVKDIGKEFEQELEDGLQDIEDMGFDVSYDINGGVGAYFGIEVISDSADVDGVTCYDVQIKGALAIDFGLSASIDGSVTDPTFGTISIDGSGNGFIEVEMNLDGHMYLTVDEMALAKIDLTFTAEGQGEVHLDADMSMEGMTQSIKADAEISIDDVQIDFDLAFDPPLDIYQFPMWEGKTWYVPGYDTDVSGSLIAQGTITHDYTLVVPGEPIESDSGTINLATEIGTNSFFETVPGGEYDYWTGGGGALFTCVYASGNIFIIETEMGDAFGYMDFGTRQGIPDMDGMIPSAGLQINAEIGLITGMTMDGELMTSEVTSAEVDDFADDPLAEVKSETGGHDAGNPLLGILLIGVIFIVVVIVVVVILTKKKAPPQQQPPQQYGQQPPPPPPEYQPPADQYQQPPADQYQQPPPPPPPGQ